MAVPPDYPSLTPIHTHNNTPIAILIHIHQHHHNQKIMSMDIHQLQLDHILIANNRDHTESRLVSVMMNPNCHQIRYLSAKHIAVYFQRYPPNIQILNFFLMDIMKNPKLTLNTYTHTMLALTSMYFIVYVSCTIINILTYLYINNMITIYFAITITITQSLATLR